MHVYCLILMISEVLIICWSPCTCCGITRRSTMIRNAWTIHPRYDLILQLNTPRSSASLNSIIMWRVKTILGDPGAVSRAGRKGATKVFKHRRKSPWVPTLTGPFPNGQANAGSWLGTKNALYYCAQSANSISWVLFVSLYTTAIDSITACLAHAPKKGMHVVRNLSVWYKRYISKY